MKDASSSIVANPVTSSSTAMAPFSDGSIDGDVIIQDSSRSSPVQVGKRRVEDGSPSADAKKLKLTTTAKENASASTSIKPTPAANNKDAVVVLKAGKFVLKQKTLSWESSPNAMRAKLGFIDFVTALIEDDTAKLTVWPKEHWNVVAHLIHESDKTLSGLAQSVRKQLVDSVQSSLAAAEDSQDADDGDYPTKKPQGIILADRIPQSDLAALIESLATRTNYGLDVSDLSGLGGVLPEGVAAIPAGLQVWRWEVKDLGLMPAEFGKKLEARRNEREQVKLLAVSNFNALSPSEQTDLLSKSTSRRPPAAAAATKASASTPTSTTTTTATASSSTSDPDGPVASTSAANPPATEVVPKKPKAEKKVKVEDPEVAREKEERRRKKEEEERVKEERKAVREEKKKAQLEKEEKAIKDKSKMAGMMMGFFQKKSMSPVPVDAHSPQKGKESDFDKMFKPFYLKNDVTIAPINRFKKARVGKAPPGVQINSVESLTLQDSLADFMKGVPKHRIVAYNPRPEPRLSVRDAVHYINDAAATGMDASAVYKDLANRSKVQAKFLKFKEDVRPGYVGTWTKKSRVVTPRTPFGKDTALLRYEYDSEDEWEEEEVDPDAEDVNSGGEDSEDAVDSDGSLSDDWMCEDDEVEYMPGHEDEAGTPMEVDDDVVVVGGGEGLEQAKRKIAERERKSKMGKEGAKKKRQLAPMVPVALGPSWESTIGVTTYKPFESMKIQFLNDAKFGLNPLKWESKPLINSAVAAAKLASAASAAAAVLSSSTLSTAADDSLAPASDSTPGPGSDVPPRKNTKSQPRGPVKPLPEAAFPQFVKIVHGAKWTMLALKDELYRELREQKVTRATIEKTLGEVGMRPNGQQGPWEVKPEFLAKYSPSSIVVD